jgi:hypothetical protein
MYHAIRASSVRRLPMLIERSPLAVTVARSAICRNETSLGPSLSYRTPNDSGSASNNYIRIDLACDTMKDELQELLVKESLPNVTYLAARHFIESLDYEATFAVQRSDSRSEDRREFQASVSSGCGSSYRRDHSSVLRILNGEISEDEHPNEELTACPNPCRYTRRRR